jgi:tRNA (guanine-N7-)-methyltransferase
LDVGCHKGTFLAAMAQAFPDTGFLGIERQPGRVERTLAKIQRLGIGNAWVVQAEGIGALREWMPAHALAVMHVSFPDPWPKRRHERRRLVNASFLDDARALLRPDGVLRLMTDDAAYFAAMAEAARASGSFAEIAWDDGRDYPPTEFQKKFAAIGKPLHRLALRPLIAMASA